MLKKQDGFTLIEMLIVLMIITVLILLIVPTLANRTENVQDRGCDALKQTIQSQVNAYNLEIGEIPKSTQELVTEKYITKDQTTCENGKSFSIDESGIVEIVQ